MNQNARVVIVGAGPCGLAMACGLWRRGIRARVLDASSAPGQGSRAIMLWPPALEVLDELGVLPEVEAQGYRPRALAYHTGPRRAVRLELDAATSPVVLPQDRTSVVLESALQELGGRVERPARVTGVDPASDSVTVRVRGEDGVETTIEAEWLVGADGAHSTVRKALGIDFVGTQFASTFLLAEGRLDGELDRSEAHYYVTPAGVTLVIPLPGGEVRISGVLEEGAAVTAETAQRMLDERIPENALRISNLSTLTTFTAPHRIAASLRAGRCFLVGDAAHVHSPVGGQGLTLGMQDVRNLTWKLAGVVDGLLAPAILESYDPERRAAAEQVLAVTHRMTRQTLFPPMALRVRNAVLHLLDAAGVFQRMQTSMLTGRRIHYPDVLFGEAASLPRGPIASMRPKPLAAAGTRTPEWVPKADGGTGGFRLITAGPEDSELARRARFLVEQQPSFVEHRHLARPRAGFLLLRPDDFVAASGDAASHLGHTWQRLERVMAGT